MRKFIMNLSAFMLSAACAATCVLPVLAAPNDIIDTSGTGSGDNTGKLLPEDG